MIDKKTLDLFKNISKNIAPPPSLTISQWADNYRKLSSESSAEPGQWNTDRAPYQRDIMDAISDPVTEKVIVMASSQVGKSEIILNTIGYYIDYDPAPMLYLLPTKELAESISKDRLSPMFRDCESLAFKIGDEKAKDSNNTILHKKFSGGHITLVGSNAPANLSSRPIRILLADEIDRFPITAGQEGDPLMLAEKRTTTFWNKKHVYVSTPTIKDISRIEKEYKNSSMEEWCLRCPECGEFQALMWSNLKFSKKDKIVDVEGMLCTKCGAISSEVDWKSQKGKWIARSLEKKTCRGFHLNELVSPWKNWNQIVDEFLEAKKNPQTLKVWVNTSLGESWEEESEVNIEELLLKRRQYYNCEVPKNVVCLTCGVDVQDNRLEYEIVGWCKEYESYGIKYGVIMGDPGQKLVWNELDEILNRDYRREDGQVLKILTTCIDSGGHNTSEVYAYCKAREFQRVWAIKGQGGSGIPYIKRPKKRNDDRVWLFMIGVDVGKDTITSRLKINEEGPGFCHFPIEHEKGYDEQYFLGLTSERRVTKYKKGLPAIVWEKRSAGIRNEPFDLRNYATAALYILNPDLNLLYEQLNEKQSSKITIQTSKHKRYGKVSKGIEL